MKLQPNLNLVPARNQIIILVAKISMQQDFLVLFAYHNDRICFDAQRVVFFFMAAYVLLGI